jgi:alpha-L-rhamnosidase
VLYLGGACERMTLPTLRRIVALVEAGATIVGLAPKDSPSLKDDPAEFAALVGRLWSGTPVTKVGMGRVIASRDVEAALASIGVDPDFADVSAQRANDVLFVHRSLPGTDIYFVTNRSDRAINLQASFRVSGRRPEIWHADTGNSESVSYSVEGDKTFVPLEFAAEDSFFVVFRGSASATSVEVPKPRYESIATIEGPWNVAFQPGRGAPASTRLATLRSLSDAEDPQVRFFSGTATYKKNFSLPKRPMPDSPLLLDLGQVGDVAEVLVNGQTIGIAWKAPYRVDIGAAVRSGVNALEVRVANLWVNRLVGDAQPDAKKVTFTALPTYRADAPLRPSGLIGPVRILGIQEK